LNPSSLPFFMEHGIIYTPKRHYKKKPKESWYCFECFKGYAGLCIMGMTAIAPYPTEEKCPHRRHHFLSSNNFVGVGGEE